MAELPWNCSRQFANPEVFPMLDPTFAQGLWDLVFLTMLSAYVVLRAGEMWAAWQLMFFAAVACVPLAAEASVSALAAVSIMTPCTYLTVQTAYLARPPT